MSLQSGTAKKEVGQSLGSGRLRRNAIEDLAQHSESVLTDAATQARAVLKMENISKRFGSQVSLRSVNLQIAEGEILVVLGPSGNGKSTLLRIISGLESPDGGSIYLNGRNATAFSPQQRELGVVFQEQALFQKMSVAHNIAFGLRIRRESSSHSKKVVDNLLSLIRLDDHRHKYPSQLSGGQRQRVAVARALAHGPRVMLFDEPFSALDAVTRTELRREVRTLLKEMKVAALFITHDQEEALELADTVAILHAGEIEQIGTPYEIYNRPATEFVATFLGAANVLVGSWHRDEVVLGATHLRPPVSVPELVDGQAIKVVFRPEDVVLNFQAQLLGTPYYLGRGTIESVTYVGPTERLLVRLPQNKGNDRTPRLVTSGTGDHKPEGAWFSVAVSRTKWEASEMELSPGDPIVVGLKEYRVLPYYPVAE